MACSNSLRRLVLLTLMTVALDAAAPHASAQPVELPEPTRRNVIVQLFNWKFSEIEAVLPELKKLGYSHVHVSPPQLSVNRPEWMFRYQPLDYTRIEGPLGDLAAFKSMNDHADQAGMNIIVDAVLNHMAGDEEHANLLFPPSFGPDDFHPKVQTTDENADTIQKGWLGLPDLKTETPHVREVAKTYLKMLLDLGVDGFRFDAIKHIEPEFFDEVMQVVPDDKLSFGEYVSDDPGPMLVYANITEGEVDLYDFPLLRTMQKAFGPNGDLRSLRDPAADGHALPGTSAITFVRNHDTDRNIASNGANGISGWWINENDFELAYAYILGREAGTPYIFVDMPDAQPQDDKYDNPVVAAGVRFHDLCLADPADASTRRAESWIIDEPNIIAFRRGDDALMAINKSADDSPRPAFASGLRDGRYVELQSKQTLRVSGGKMPADWSLPKRSAVFLVRLGD